MQLQKAQRKRAKIKLGLQGPSGSGKTYSSLLIAYGLSGDYSKVAVIDTENHSASLYAHLGEFQVVNMSSPFTPEKYISAIEMCEKAGMEVIIIDSITHEWENLLEYHSSLQGNSFTNWSKITPRHNTFIQRMLQSPCHIISTVRTKQDYVLNEKNGRMTPEKVGLKSVQREGLEYEFTLVFDLDMKNNALTSKDRTNLFSGKPETKLTAETGRQILDWCLSGTDVNVDDVSDRIGECKSINELLTLYKTFPQFQEVLKRDYEKRKRELIINISDESKEISALPRATNGAI
jgi:AAA domain